MPRAQTGIISNSTFSAILRTCNFSDVGPFVTSKQNCSARSACYVGCLHNYYTISMAALGKVAEPGDDCSAAVNQADEEMGDINLYDIYVEACIGTSRDRRHFGNGGVSLFRR